MRPGTGEEGSKEKGSGRYQTFTVRGLEVKMELGPLQP
ncbi:hypothetical protein POX_a01504 [Penicillium oxalicum]|nr:hypothetical protein POX_a01504 [Penicillium oxalicum]KAI2794903.1 hypothetical protein POX_a01504 [Penicillium oxalicum]